jgi:hypothetical protein
MPNDCHNRLIVDYDFAFGGITAKPAWFFWGVVVAVALTNAEQP